MEAPGGSGGGAITAGNGGPRNEIRCGETSLESTAGTYGTKGAKESVPEGAAGGAGGIRPANDMIAKYCPAEAGNGGAGAASPGLPATTGPKKTLVAAENGHAGHDGCVVIIPG